MGGSFTSMYSSVFMASSRGILSRDQGLPCVQLSSSVLRFDNSSAGLHRLSGLSPDLQDSAVLGSVLPPCTAIINSLQVVGLGTFRAHSICFLSLWDYCPLVPDVQCFTISSFTYFVFSKIVSREGKCGLLPQEVTYTLLSQIVTAMFRVNNNSCQLLHP